MKIYIIRNTINRKVYIGQTRHSLAYRMRKHIYDSFYHKKKSNTKFYRAIRKYGGDCFYIKSICECKDLHDMNEKEKFYISLYNSVNKGYNTTLGGVISMTEEIKKKISKALTGRKLSEETKLKIGLSNKGKQFNLGRKHSDESRRRMSEGQKGRVVSESQRKKISDTLKTLNGGKDNPFYGKKHSEESRLKMSEKRKGKKPSGKITGEDIIKMKDMYESGVSLTEISKSFPVSIARISQIKKENNWVQLKEN